MHTFVAGIGAVIAAVGSGVLLARCFRTPRGDLIAWSVGLLGLLVSLGAQAMGYLSGFDPTMFRAMELGGQVIAPLAFALALSEVAGKSTAARFCARLYLPALGIVALVVLALDQLTQAKFSKAWPPPFTFYQLPPNYVLTLAVGPVTALVAVIAVVTVLARSGQPGWRDVVPGQLFGGAATLGLAYPALAQLIIQHLHIHLPLGSVFSVACTLAACLAWLAGVRTSRVPLAALRGQPDQGWDDRAHTPSRDRADGYRERHNGANGYHDADGYGAPDPSARNGRSGRDNAYGDARYFESAAEGGVYRGGGLYRPDPSAQAAARDRIRDDWLEDDPPGDGYAEFATGDYLPGDFAADGWQSRPDPDGRAAGYDDRPRGRGGRGPGGPHEADDADRRRAELFGQITIYTLAESRVDAFDQLTERIVELVRRREPEALVFIAHAVPSAPTQRILYQVYRSKAAYQKHLAQPYMQQFELDRRPYVQATNVVELGLQQAKVTPFPSVTELFPEPGYDTSGFERPDYLRDYGKTSPQAGGGAREYR
jgi:quinol monooxygenase YgiN